MAKLWYSHFDSTSEDQRLLLAEDWAKYIRNFLGDGIKNGGTCLQITADGQGLHTLLDEGYANIQGYFFRCEEDNSGRYYKIAHPSPHPTEPRIDRIVLRLDRTIAQRNILPEILIGQTGANPRPPELTRNSNIWEISLAQVRVPQGITAILPEYITDERLDSSVCGIIDSLITADTAQMYRDFREAFAAMTRDMEAEFDEWMLFQRGRGDDLYDEIRFWYGSVKTDISKLQTFDFDNMPELPETTRTTEFFEDGTILERIVKNLDGLPVAQRRTVFGGGTLEGGETVPDNGIQERTTLYDEDGVAILKDVSVMTTFEDDGTIKEVATLC